MILCSLLLSLTTKLEGTNNEKNESDGKAHRESNLESKNQQRKIIHTEMTTL